MTHTPSERDIRNASNSQLMEYVRTVKDASLLQVVLDEIRVRGLTLPEPPIGLPEPPIGSGN